MKKLIVTIFAGIACAAAVVCIAMKLQDIYYMCKCLGVEDEDAEAGTPKYSPKEETPDKTQSEKS